MKSSWKLLAVSALISMVSFYGNWAVLAAEHGGTTLTQEHGGKLLAAEHGGKEHAGEETAAPAAEETPEEEMEAPAAEPSAQEIKDTMKEHVEEKTSEDGSFLIMDDKTGQMRQLVLERVHERVGKTGDYYYSCADFNDKISGEKIDVDLDVENAGGNLSVVDARIHKVNGKERYTYDKNDNRIPIKQ